jgi:hypothetical protein
LDRKTGSWDSQTSHSPGPLATIQRQSTNQIKSKYYETNFNYFLAFSNDFMWK